MIARSVRAGSVRNGAMRIGTARAGTARAGRRGFASVDRRGFASATLVVLALSVLAGCTSRQVYQGAQGWRRSTCDGIVDPERRAACIEAADRDFDAYRRDRDPRPY